MEPDRALLSKLSVLGGSASLAWGHRRAMLGGTPCPLEALCVAHHVAPLCDSPTWPWDTLLLSLCISVVL